MKRERTRRRHRPGPHRENSDMRPYAPTRQAEPATLIAADGVSLRAEHRPAADGARARLRGGSRVHGSPRHAGDPSCRRRPDAARGCRGGVDARVTAPAAAPPPWVTVEVLDVDAAVRLGAPVSATRRWRPWASRWAASVVVRHAALYGGVDAVVSVSAPARWNYRGTPPMRRLHAVVGSRFGRSVARRLRRTRITETCLWSEPYPMEPRVAAAVLAPVPLLVAHGDVDHYFPLDHARAAGRRGGPCRAVGGVRLRARGERDQRRPDGADRGLGLGARPVVRQVGVSASRSATGRRPGGGRAGRARWSGSPTAGDARRRRRRGAASATTRGSRECSRRRRSSSTASPSATSTRTTSRSSTANDRRGPALPSPVADFSRRARRPGPRSSSR